MTPAELKASLSAEAPPAGLDAALAVLWWAAKGDWHKAHSIAQEHEDEADGAWVHAHLHRIEGDLDNAGYWYRRAGRPRSTAPLPEEWNEIAAALLR
ncbi:MAG: hypothetical protein AB7P02_15985 [Alphaproteobacteria bacterium]